MVMLPAPAVCRKPRRDSDSFIAASLAGGSLLLLERGACGLSNVVFAGS